MTHASSPTPVDAGLPQCAAVALGPPDSATACPRAENTTNQARERHWDNRKPCEGGSRPPATMAHRKNCEEVQTVRNRRVGAGGNGENDTNLAARSLPVRHPRPHACTGVEQQPLLHTIGAKPAAGRSQGANGQRSYAEGESHTPQRGSSFARLRMLLTVRKDPHERAQNLKQAHFPPAHDTKHSLGLSGFMTQYVPR